MTVKDAEKIVYVLSESFGKDSMAMLDEIMRRKLPVDYVIHCDIKFNNEISGEHPLMAEWIPYAEKRIKELYGVDIIHLTSKRNFTEWFYKVKERGNHKGGIYGYPYIRQSWCNGVLKLDPINKFIKDLLRQGYKVVEYIGIASDEPKRLERYKELETENHKYITLADFGIDELEALEICKRKGLLSPKYENSFRGGCWFCPKQSMWDLYQLWKNYPKYFEILVEMEKDSFNTFKPNKSITQIKQDFENGKVPKRTHKHKQTSIFDTEGEQ